MRFKVISDRESRFDQGQSLVLVIPIVILGNAGLLRCQQVALLRGRG